MWAAFLNRFPGLSDITMLFGLNLLIHSTLIILIGLGGLYILRKKRRGTASQSLLLWFCLIAVLLTSPALLISSAAGVRGLYIPIPLPRVPAVSAPVVSAPQAYPPISPSTPTGGQSGLEENSAGQQPAGKILATAPPAKQQPVTTAPVKPRSVPAAPKSALLPKKTVIPHTSTHSILPSIAILFSLFWIALSLFLALRFGAITLYIRRIRRLSSPAEPRHTALCRAVADELGISAPQILQSPYVTSILLTGLFRPAILLPSGGNEIVLATREVFLHELAHLARRDPFWLHLCQLAKIIFPFQPLLWVLSRHIEELSDFACDDFVIRHTGLNRPYATQLFNLARSFQPQGIEARAGSGILSSRFPLLRRIERILDNTYTRHITASANEVMSFSILFLCAVTMTGFIGLRAEGAVGKTYASEHRLRDNGKPKAKMSTLLHKPLSAVLAGRTMIQEQAAAEESREEETTPAGERENDPSPSAESIPPAGESTPAESPAPVILAMASIDQEMTRISSQPDAVSSQKPEEQKPGADADSAVFEVRPEEAKPVQKELSGKTTASSATESREKSSSKTENAQSMQFFPDLRELSSAVTDKRETVTAKTGPLEISIPGGLPSALRESLESGQQNPVWSPSGKIIAFTGSSGMGIWAVSAQGGKPILVLDNTNEPVSKEIVSSGGISRTLCFTPDGREITYLKFIPKPAGSGVKKEASAEAVSLMPVIENINLFTGERRVIAEGATEGSWSRDGRYFVYAEGDSRGIGVLDTSTGKRRVISETGLSPCLTPDGLSIIYVDQGWVDLFYQLYRAPIAGGKPEQLTTDGNWWGPQISPDGEWVLCTGYGISRYSQYALLRVFNLRERMSYFIRVEGAETAEMGAWSPTGRQFCYTRISDMIKDGFTSRRSTIYIDNFQSSSLNRPAAETTKPSEFKLVGNFPNPFNPSTTIRFSIPSAGPAELEVYNMMGQKIRSLVSGRLEAGMHSIVWNGRDQENRPVSSGTYVARLKMEGKVETRRMTLVK
ncbi:MAG: M56 family metallopeptidase [Candidatus Latescibacter sp.]|nr:M56 family metallopeptidase [Candidatus Latescibacter sp.]